jgi:DNA-binding beta-propeller fold protein YncE
MSILGIKLNNINHNTDQQYHHYLNISLLISIGVLLSTIVFSSVNAFENGSAEDHSLFTFFEKIKNAPETDKINTKILSQLSPKPANTTKTLDAKAFDSLMQPLSEHTQSEKSKNPFGKSATTNSPQSPSSSQLNFKTATIYEFVKKWGSKGTGDGQFQRVHDLDFDPTEKYLYTIDRDGNRVQVFDKDGNFIKKWGSKGTGDGQFTVPYSVDVDSKGDVWVADRGNHRIQKFDKDGNFLFKFGTFGSKEGQFNNPRQVAVDKDVKFLYVADSKNNRIQKFDTNGNFIKSWGTLGSGDGQFILPVTAIIDSKGDIVVNDRGTNRVQKFDPDGNFLLKFGSTGTSNSQFSEVEHMATDKFDDIYVNDPQLGVNGSGNPSVKKFDTNGNFITKFGSLGKGNGQFTDPEHLALDSYGNVYVSDRKANTITVFKPVM